MPQKFNYKKLAWNILGTLFLLFLAACFAWNYNARLTETPYANQMIATLFQPRTQTFEAENMECGGVGLRVTDQPAFNGASRENSTQQEIFVCGPYKNFFPGYYEARFRIRPESIASGNVHLDIVSDKGTRVLASSDIDIATVSQTYDNVVIPFGTGINTGLEFRVMGPKEGKILVDSITVQQKNKSFIPAFKTVWNKIFSR